MASRLHQLPENHVENGLHHNQLTSENTFLSGIKQRLLSFIFRGLWNEEMDQNLVGYLTFSILFDLLVFLFFGLSH